MTRKNTMSAKAAKAAGYRALTCIYQLPREQCLLQGVLTDMQRGNIRHVLVKGRTGVAVWRSLRTANIRSDSMQFANGRAPREMKNAECRVQNGGAYETV
jgi:hypothetical protein